MGDYLFGQEYDLQFVDDATSIFGEDTIAAAFADMTIAPLFEESA